jgi:short-subunit dehydrogenase
MNLDGKMMLVTGASSGIGAATAKAAARVGAQVVLCARTRSKLEQVADEIRQAGRRAWVYPVDLTNADAVREMARQLSNDVGTPDIIVNNAGAGQWLFAEETSAEESVQMMAAPYFAAFFITRAFLPDLLQRQSGYIVNVTSAAAYMAWPGATAYTAARWAMRGFTEALQADLSKTNIQTMLATFAQVKSDYWANNPGSERRIPRAQHMIPVLSSEAAAAALIKGIEQNRREVVEPLMLRMVLWLNRLCPALNRRLVLSTGYKRLTENS